MEISTNEVKLALTLSTISRRKILLRKPLSESSSNQTREYLQFMKRITKGSEIEEKPDGFSYTPGTIQGGAISFQCIHNTVPDLIANILPMLAFCRIPVRLSIKGTTNAKDSLSIDMIRAVYCKILSQFGVVSEIKINRRAIHPSHDGDVLLIAETANSLNPIVCDKREELKRIIGINYSARINSDVLHRITNVARDKLKPITPSVKIYNDIGNSKTSAETPGFGSILLAFGNNSIYEAECTIDGSDSLIDVPAEKRMTNLLRNFLKNIRTSGSYSHTIQHFVFVLLALTTVDGSAVIIRKISKKDKEVLFLLEEILKYTYTIEPYVKTENDIESGLSDELLLIKSCGVGYTNIHKPVQ
ncbi:RNA 3'-terminal phosphate cyclase-like protein [Nematocida minor]|uniref:RNA 3'-terminal phosphate cyclase-like protein n=1 Tax=Nematocida minor TaxID=1912983 RepID=UPI002221118C|nr:RNA 3'-terminal phosphate cyclase-like protein [Nematocida minor]KAI5192547.1 RNA 3'-terminal phosphate cyclase-like protein [Nematocida minor]